MYSIDFIKMHGLGNDFVIIDKNNLPEEYNPQQLAKIVANRDIGLGCDQFIIYSKNQAVTALYEMFIYNQDGSPAKACGNASRCLAKLMYLDNGEQNIVLNVAGRVIHTKVVSKDEFQVNMGKASFNEAWMPLQEKLWAVAESYAVESKEMICVDIGNPHLVIFSSLSEKDKAIIGKAMQENELFPEGVNVNFAKIIDDKIYLEVWERGAGFTLACGSGACASFAAATKLGFTGEKVEVAFKLGSLKMSKEQGDIIMSGDATLVARGKLYYE